MTQNQVFELSEDYKIMIDKMLEQEDNGEVIYISSEEIKNRFLPGPQIL